MSTTKHFPKINQPSHTVLSKLFTFGESILKKSGLPSDYFYGVFFLFEGHELAVFHSGYVSLWISTGKPFFFLTESVMG